MFTKAIGGILIIAGMTIGASMLILPIDTGLHGFWSSIVVFVLCWAVMLFSAFLILEASLYVPLRSNFPTMMKHTLPFAIRVVAWVFYLILLYALLSVYLNGMGELLTSFIIHVFHVRAVHWATVLAVVLLWSMFIYIGARAVDPINRLLIITMLIIFVILSLNLVPYVEPKRLMTPYSSRTWLMLPIIMAAFGYQMVIPSIRDYLDGNIKLLRITIFVGTLIPLFVYIIWQAIIIGVIPLEGFHGLKSLFYHGANVDLLAEVLGAISQNRGVAFGFSFFGFFAIATSSLCVGLALFDFMADSLSMLKEKPNKFLVLLACFVPPFIFATEFSGAFNKILQYAGVLFALLFVFLPVMMVWRGRYSQYTPTEYRVMGGKAALIIPIVMTIATIFMQLFFQY